MLLYVYLKVPRKQAKEIVQSLQKVVAVEWIEDSEILVGTLPEVNLATAVAVDLLQRPEVASVELAPEVFDAPHRHMQKKDWERLAELRADKDFITPAERKEMLALMEKSSLEFSHKAYPWTRATFGHLLETQVRMLKNLERTCVQHEAKAASKANAVSKRKLKTPTGRKK